METLTERLIEVETGIANLQGILGMPNEAKGVVLFAHGSGSGVRRGGGACGGHCGAAPSRWSRAIDH